MFNSYHNYKGAALLEDKYDDEIEISENGDARFKKVITNTISSTGNSIDFSSCSLTGIQAINGIAPNGTSAGQLLKTSIFNIADYNFSTIATFNGLTTIWSFSFTPINVSSYLLIDFYTLYDTNDSFERDDSWQAFLRVNGAQIGKTQQITYGQQGTLLPITGKYINTSTASKTISFLATRINAVGDIVFVADNSFSNLVISEIKR